MKDYKKVAVLDYSSGSVYIHELPAGVDTETALAEIGYSLDNIHWMDGVKYISLRVNFE